MSRLLPTSCYRLQLSESFQLQDVKRILGYLSRLGVEMICLSPLFEIEKGSPNPYKIISPKRINPRYRGEKAFNEFVRACKKHNILHMLDLVPNHMGATPENPWWRDLLKHGPYSQYAAYFDIDWKNADGKIILPLLYDGAKIKKRKQAFVIDNIRLPMREGECDLHHQYYSLIHWRKMHQEINYRRFFDIADLVGIRMENKELFDVYHKKVFEWIKKGKVHALRIDHPDGLWDPAAYLKKLRKDGGQVYTVCEKILQHDEEMRSDWAVEGSVGYDALNLLNALFVDRSCEEEFTALWREMTKETGDPEKMLIDEKQKIMKSYLLSEINRFSHEIYNIAVEQKEVFNIDDLQQALIEWLSLIPVYRTYVTSKAFRPCNKDRKALASFLHHSLSMRKPYRDFFAHKIYKKPYRSVLLRLQQLMPAVFAKGFEDTFLYLYLRLTSLNEVGSNPTQFGISIREFHRLNRKRQEHFPYSMIATSTHDTKRSEDVRMRIHVLSERPAHFKKWLKQWRRYNGTFEDLNFDYLFYQTLLGCWPAEQPSLNQKRHLRKRIKAYMLKAACEAKRHTSWIEHDKEYETKLMTFIDTILKKSQTDPFWKSFYLFLEEIDLYGKYNSLSCLVLKVGMPGISDFYQGNECWRYDLVDPDNRRRIDFKRLAKILKEIEKTPIDDDMLLNWFHHPEDSKIKMYVTKKALEIRKRYRDLFLHGRYIPLMTHRNDLIAFARSWQGVEVRIFAARFYSHHLGEIPIPVKRGFVDIFTQTSSTPLPFSIQIMDSSLI